MVSNPCPFCGCTEIDEDPSRGDAVCTECGSVLDENCIVSEVQFQEDARGASRAVGTLTNEDGTVHSSLGGGRFNLRKSSRDITIYNAKKKIGLLCSQLKLPSRGLEMSLNFYKLALKEKLTKGRKNSHVIAACVYLTCRQIETSHMLLDLSDILQVNVYELGRTYSRLASALNVDKPVVDPSLYCMRFASQLQLGDKTHAVFITASRIVQRMKKDWMHAGRRPAGLCGAALLVAARRHNFNRTVKDIIKVVKVCSATVRKRLTEFGETPSSRLTLDEFMKIDLEEEHDPPAFTNIMKRKLKELEEPSEEVKKQVHEFRKEIEKALEETRKKKLLKGKYALFTPTDGASSEDGHYPTEQFVLEDTLRTINEDLLANAGGKAISEEQVNNIILPDSCHKYLNAALSNPEKTGCEDIDPSLASIGIKQVAEGVIDCREDDVKAVELDLSGLDDKELDAYIMNDNEAKGKIELWIRTNISYLREHTEREEKRAREEEENVNRPERKKRKRLKRAPIQANTPGEAIEQMVQQKRISNKLDYDVLKRLGCGVDSEPTEKESPVEDDKTPKKTPRSKSTKTPCSSVVPQHLKERLSAFIPSPKWKDSLPLDDDQDEVDALQAPDEENIVSSSVEPDADNSEQLLGVIESEPEVIVENHVTTYNEQDEDEQEFDDDDDDLPSAAQLLGRYGGHDEMDDYDYQDDYYDC